MASNKRGIPELRDRLREIADEEGLGEIHDICDEMCRNSPIKRAANKSRPLTPALAKEIRAYVKKHPRLHQRDVAQKFNVNPGRVSEALHHQT